MYSYMCKPSYSLAEKDGEKEKEKNFCTNEMKQVFEV